MGKERSPYEILGVSPGSSREEITRAYRRLAVRFHPDKRPDDGTFLEIKEAYETIKKNGFHQAKSSPQASRSPVWHGNLKISIEVSLKEMAECREKTITYMRKKVCRKCEKVQCVYCGGTGRDPISLVVGPKRLCHKCRGDGYLRMHKDCEVCKGRGFTEEQASVKLRLYPLINGPVVFKDRGNELEDGWGDLIMEVMVRKDPIYQATGLHLKRSLEISPVQAIIGDTILLDVWGRTVDFQIPAGTQNNQVVRKTAAGMTHGSRAGDMHVTVRIKVPNIISTEEREIYEQILKIEKENVCRNL